MDVFEKQDCLIDDLWGEKKLANLWSKLIERHKKKHADEPMAGEELELGCLIRLKLS